MTPKIFDRSCWALAIALLWLFAQSSSAVAAEPMAYVANEKSDDVSVIDTTTDSVARTIHVGKRPRGVAISPDRRHVYIANGNSDDISVIDAEAAKQAGLN